MHPKSVTPSFAQRGQGEQLNPAGAVSDTGLTLIH